MNIYQKLQKCRVELQSTSLKKTGNNKFAGYTYYELGDFLPTINKLMMDNGLTSIVSFTTTATLTIINADNPEEFVIFESPLADAQLKGCHPIQNLGAAQTYLRRYLYSNAFEIVEHDALDATTGKPDKTEDKPKQDIPKTDTKKVDYPQKITDLLLIMTNNNKDEAINLLEQYTSWTNSEGKEIKGKRTTQGMSEGALKATYGKVKKAYEESKKPA